MSKRINNGWYEWRPNDNCTVAWLDLIQVVQVIEGMVWAAGVRDEVSVSEAKKSGHFVRRIKLGE